MDGDMFSSYTDLLNSASPNSQFDEIATSNESPVIEVQRKSQRTKNFSHDEDILIVSAWLNTCKDAICGNEQTSSRFWRRIYDEFKSNGGELGRSEKSVKHRWQQINKQCGKFAGCVKQIDDRHQSGQSTHGKLIEAKQLFIANEKKAFQLEHCFELLQNERKWHETFTTQKGCSFVDLDGDAIPLGDNSEPSSAQSRPLGRKASKEQVSRKKANLQTGSSSTMSIMDERWKEMMDLERQKLELRTRQIEAHDVSREMEIMEKNIEGMDPILAAYWNGMKNEILRKRGLI